MKKFFVTMMMALAIVGMAGCQKEKITPVDGSSTPDNPTAYSLVNTSWQGVYNDHVVHPQAGQLPCTLNWIMDFLDSTNVAILLELNVGGQSQPAQELSAEYTLNGLNGELIAREGDEVQTTPFVVDTINRTLTVDLSIYTGFSQDQPQAVGGSTVFHQIR